MKIELNAEHNGIEIYFGNRPSKTQLDTLKADGWKWHNTKKCWYAKDTTEHRATAESLSIDSVTEPKAPAPPTIPQKRPTRRESKPSEYKYCLYYVSDGQRNFKCYYTIDEITLDITINYDTYGNAPTPTGCTFKNDSDGTSDYFEKSIVIAPVTAPDYLAILDTFERRRAKHADYEPYSEETYNAITAEARKIAEAIADGAMTTAEAEAIRAERIEADKKARDEATKAMNKATATKWIASGEATEKSGKAVYKDNTVFYEMFSNKKITEYTLVVIDLTTGERSKQSGRYSTEQERDTAEAEAVT